MSYTKIYYDDIWAATSKGCIKCSDWLPNLEKLSKSFNSFIESESFKGHAATNVKNYLEQIHGIIVSIIGSVVQSYSVLAADYYGGYRRLVDSGDSNEFGMRYTTIVSEEVSEIGSIQSKLNDIIRAMGQVASDANSVKNSISDLVSMVSYPKTNNLYEQINAAKSKAQTVHNNAIAYEASRANDFVEIDRLISQALLIINAQIGKNRVPVVAYQSGSIGNLCDIDQILVDLNATSEKINAIIEKGYCEEDASIAFYRDDTIQAEEEASREWIQWVAVGVAVVGSVVLAAVTLGAASPLVCAAVGAGVSIATVSTSKFADNYVKTGSFVEGMDWRDFGKDVAVAAVGGAVAGYLGAVSQGSAIKQPIEKGITAFTNKAVEEGAKGLTATIWETGETIYDVGEAWHAGKPGDEILSILDQGLDEINDEALGTLKGIAVEGTKEFVGGTVAGHFDIDTSDKSVLRKMGEKTAESVAGGAAGGTIKIIWNVGEAIVDDDSSTTISSAIKVGAKETIQDIASSTVSTVVSEGAFHKVDDIDNKVGNIIGNTIKDSSSDITKKVTEGVVGRSMDYVYGDEKDAGKILGNIWEEDLDSGRSIAKSVGENVGKTIAKEVHNDDKYYNDLKKIDSDGDGKIEVVQFDDYAVTKQDYDAAVENAGKGAYKDKTVQDILGLSKDTDISTGKQRVVSIDMTEKYSSDRKTTDTVTVGGKYTFSKDFYESSLNVAGSVEYGEKTAQEILGIPNDVDLSDDNIEYKRIHNDKIGVGKEVELHKDYGTNATKIHISSMKRETREAREAKKQNNK